MILSLEPGTVLHGQRVLRLQVDKRLLIRDLESQEILGQTVGGRKVRRDLGLDPHSLPEKTAVMGKTNK